MTDYRLTNLARLPLLMLKLWRAILERQEGTAVGLRIANAFAHHSRRFNARRLPRRTGRQHSGVARGPVRKFRGQVASRIVVRITRWQSELVAECVRVRDQCLFSFVVKAAKVHIVNQ